MIRIHLFGNWRMSVAGDPVAAVQTSRLQSLLAYLILHAQAPQPRERLAFLLWPASSESQARTNLRQLLHHLKRALPPDCDFVETSHLTMQWRLDADCVIDTVEFQAALAGAETARAHGDPAGELAALDSATRIYEDDLLPGIYDDWLTPLREEFRRQVCAALQRLAGLFHQHHNYSAGIERAERLVALDPLNESHHQLLIQLYAANQDRASALRAYHQCMRVLRREMGVEPGPATRELFERILKAQPGQATPAERESADGSAKPSLQLQKVRALVGRGTEWNELATVWQAAAETGPRVAVISGEPGIGKTRLAEELYQSCVRQGHAVARSRCYAGQGQIAYAPIVEWLRGDTLRAGWAQLPRAELAELARLAPEICEQFPGVEALRPTDGGTGERWQRLHFYESLSAAFGKCRKPLLLYLDDLQWCDPETLEWLHLLLTSPAARGILLVGTVRSEETGREHPFTRFLAGLRQLGIVREFPLAALNAEETAELARLESPRALERGRLEEIIRATRGNPLFVVESVRAGLQSTRVHAVIASRLAQLTPAAYELAGYASVVGRPVSFELLEKATDWDGASISQALEELWQRRIVESSGSAEYDFTHDRLREVVAGEMSLVRQRYLHRRVAQALEEMHRQDPEPWAAQVAAHLDQAGMAEAAIEAYVCAAAYSRQNFADQEAAALLRRALALCRGFSESERRLHQELGLLTKLGPALVTTEGYSAREVGETYQGALDLSKRLGNQNEFAILSGLWLYHMVRGDLEQARQFGATFLKAADRDAAPSLVQAGDFLVGSSLFHLGRLEESRHHLAAAVAASGAASESVLTLFAGPDVGVFCRCYLGHAAWHRDPDGRADAHAVEAIEAATRIRQPFSQAIALAYAAMLHVFGADSHAARERGREAVVLCQRHGFAYYLAMANVLTGWAEAAQGNQEAGLEQLRAGLEEMRRLGAEIRLPFYYALLAETLGRMGKTGEAMANISNGFAYTSKNSEHWTVAELYRVQGELLSLEGRSEPAKTSFQQGIQAAREAGSVGFERRLLAVALRTAVSRSAERS